MPGLNRRGGDGNKKTSRGLGASSRLRAHRAGARGSVPAAARPERPLPVPEARHRELGSDLPRQGKKRDGERKGTGPRTGSSPGTAAGHKAPAEHGRGAPRTDGGSRRGPPGPARSRSPRSPPAEEGDPRRAARRRERGARCCQLK